MIMSVMDHMSREELLRAQASARVYQERADTALAPWDIRAPAPVLGKDVDTYRRDLAVKLKKMLPEVHELRRVQYRRLDNQTLGIFEPQLYQAVRDIAHDPTSVPRGEFRRVVSVDANGMKIVNFIGQESFVKQFTRPGRRVKSFTRLVDHYGRPM
jgi:hypothetical protein